MQHEPSQVPKVCLTDASGVPLVHAPENPIEITEGDGFGVLSISRSYVFDGTDTVQLRTPNTFKTALATSDGDTAVWTPANSKKFRLMSFRIEVTSNSAQATPGNFEVVLRDGTTPIGLGTSLFLPSVAGSSFLASHTTGWISLGNGYLSSTPNTALNVNLSAALTSGEVRVVAIGTEE